MNIIHCYTLLFGADFRVEITGSRTNPHEDNSPPDKNKAQATIAHQDHNP